MADYVFKEQEGRLVFVGDFDGLYRSEDDPWGQSGVAGQSGKYYSFSRTNLVDALRRQGLHVLPGPLLGLEVGCGHGHVLHRLWADLPAVEWYGMDISERALERARGTYPRLTFAQGDIRSPSLIPASTPFFKAVEGTFDVVILSQVWWYVLEELQPTLVNCYNLLKEGGHLVVTQAFLREQRYGRELAIGFNGAVRLLLEQLGGSMTLVDVQYDASGRFIHNDGVIVFQKAT